MSDQRISDHLANERTFLAWVRTGIGIMAFGFVVVKFSLFVKQISLMLGSKIEVPQRGYSSVLGIILVAFGVLITLLAYWRYKRVERQIRDQDYIHSSVLVSVLMSCIFIAGIVLVIYLVHSIQ
jgi:putative membrane protein